MRGNGNRKQPSKKIGAISKWIDLNNPNRPPTELEKVLLDIIDHDSRHVKKMENVLTDALGIITAISIHTDQSKIEKVTSKFLNNSIIKSWKADIPKKWSNSLGKKRSAK